MAFRKFSIPQSTEQVHFELAGHGFMCKPQVPAGTLLRLAQLDDASEEEKGKNGMAALLDFFHKAMQPDSHARFMAILNDEETVVPMETLTDIAGWLAEVYAGGRPTGENSSTSSASPSTGDAWTDGASPATPTYSRSPQTAPSI